jgi:hypothetical protein
MNGYVTPDEMALRWNVTPRQVQILCKAGKIDGAEKFGSTWAIPEDTPKPTRTGKRKPGRKPKVRLDQLPTDANVAKATCRKDE